LKCVGFFSFEPNKQKVSRNTLIAVLLLEKILALSISDSVCEERKEIDNKSYWQ
jgi:hypothetical protein